MAKAAYRSNSTKGGTTPHCLQTTMQKMAQRKKRLQVVVQRAVPRAEACAEIFAEKIAEMDDAKSCADFRAVIRAEGLQKNGSDAETVCRNGLQK